MKYVLLLMTVLLNSDLMAQNAQLQRFPRFTYEQITNLAGPSRLSHRIFYTRNSTGPDAKWFDTVKEGNLDFVKDMVNKGQNIEVKDNASLGQTALGWAAFLGYMDIVEYLISIGADIYATDRADVANVLKSAVLGGHLDILEYVYPLFNGRLNLNDQDERDGETALMVAVGNNRVDAVNWLLEQGADVNIVSTQLNRTALTFACASGNDALIERLEQAGATNVRGATCQ